MDSASGSFRAGWLSCKVGQWHCWKEGGGGEGGGGGGGVAFAQPAIVSESIESASVVDGHDGGWWIIQYIGWSYQCT